MKSLCISVFGFATAGSLKYLSLKTAKAFSQPLTANKKIKIQIKDKVQNVFHFEKHFRNSIDRGLPLLEKEFIVR